MSESLSKEVRMLKDWDSRQFNFLVDNFYIIRSALRYFAVKKQMSFSAVKISNEFPVSVPVAGACLNMLEELNIVSSRTRSSSPDLYMPQKVDMDRLKTLENILVDNYEIEAF